MLKRRTFLGMSLSAGLAAGLGSWAALGRRHRGPIGDGVLRPTRVSTYAFGTEVALTLYDDDQSHAKKAGDAAIEELQRIQRVMSLYDADSQLCRLNRTGAVERPDAALVEVLRLAQTVSEQSDGAFDVTVQPLWELHVAAESEGRAATDAELVQTCRRVDWRRVSLDRRAITLADGMAVTLNGIAQGYAADRVRTVLRRHGIRHAMIDTGEIAPLGLRPDGDAWGVGIDHPRQEQLAAVAECRDRCLATSGDYATTFGNDFARNHLFDPRTGRSPGKLASATVVAPSAALADALSTTLATCDASTALAIVRRFPACDAMLITDDGFSIQTEKFPVRA